MVVDSNVTASSDTPAAAMPAQDRVSRIAQAVEEHDYNAPENQLGAARPPACVNLDC